MKKNLKKIAVGLISTMMLQTCCFMPLASAADATMHVNVNWDNKAIGTTYGATANDTAVSAGGTGTVYVRGNKDSTGETEKGIAVVAADPTDESGANKALMINPDRKADNSTISLLNYVDRTKAGLQVFSEKVMWTAQSGECQWYLFGGSKVNIVPGTDTIAVKNNAKSETYCTLNYNEWNEFTYVFDATLAADGKWDLEKTTCTAYVNNQKLFTDTLANLKVNAQYGVMPFFTCNKGIGNGALIYFDDYINYYNLSDTSKFEIKNYDTINGSVYKEGKKIKLEAESMIGEDFGAPFDKIEWYCDGALIGTGDSIEYTTTVGEHTIYAAAYITDISAEEPVMTSENLKITVEQSYADATFNISVNWDNKAIGTTYGAKNNDTVVSAGGTGTVYVRGNKDSTGETEKGIAVVAADPTDASGANKALMINPDRKADNGTISLLNYIKKDAGLQVFSEKVMWTDQSGECTWNFNSTSKVYIVPGEENIAVKNNAKTETYCTLNYNEWNEFTYVFDVKLTADNAWDKDKTTCTAYVNNQKLFTKTLTDIGANVQYGGLVFFTCKGKGNGALVYFDDYINYYNLADESELEIKNYDAMNNAVYMAGTKLKLQADSMIGEDYGAPFDKIEWYCDGALIGTGDSIEYNTTVGGHTICAKAYVGNELKMTSEILKITVEPGFTEDVIMDEDFEDYTDGTTSWYEDDSTSNAWKAPSDASAVTVDNTHKKSLNSGLASGRSVRAETLITDGTVKISGEYYFDSTTNIYDTMMFMLNNGKRDINHLTLRGTNLYDGTNHATPGLGVAFDPAVKLATQRWYKVDLVLTFKNGQGYYNIYLDGRRLTQNAYAFGDFTSVTRTNKVTFLSSYNTTAPIYLDNLKISKINYEESSGFYDGENRVDSLGEVEGAVLTAKTLAAGGPDCRQFMAVYDKTSGRMLDVIEGTFDGATSTFTAECNISAYENFYVKTFLWNEIEPVCAPAEIR